MPFAVLALQVEAEGGGAVEQLESALSAAQAQLEAGATERALLRQQLQNAAALKTTLLVKVVVHARRGKALLKPCQIRGFREKGRSPPAETGWKGLHDSRLCCDNGCGYANPTCLFVPQEALEVGAALQADGVAVRKRHGQEVARMQAQLAAANAGAEGLEAQQAAQVSGWPVAGASSLILARHMCIAWHSAPLSS
eukprot:1158835-Pelagomonas_calceolata.AAC.7